MHRLPIAASLLIALTSAGCAWVQPTPESENVQLYAAHEVTGCEELGTTTVSLRDKVLGVNRARAQVQWELETLARNSAAKLGGNAIVPTTPIENGQQTYAIYKCGAVK